MNVKMCIRDRAATDGVMAQTKEHILLSRQVGVPYIVVFLNKCDMVDDEELIELVEMEVTEQLEEYGFNDCPIVKGSALKALEDPMGPWGDVYKRQSWRFVLCRNLVFYI